MCLPRHLALRTVNRTRVAEWFHRWDHRLGRLARAPGERLRVFISCRGYPSSQWGLEGRLRGGEGVGEVAAAMIVGARVIEARHFPAKILVRKVLDQSTRAQSNQFTKTIQPVILITLGSQLMHVPGYAKIFVHCFGVNIWTCGKGCLKICAMSWKNKDLRCVNRLICQQKWFIGQHGSPEAQNRGFAPRGTRSHRDRHLDEVLQDDSL